MLERSCTLGGAEAAATKSTLESDLCKRSNESAIEPRAGEIQLSGTIASANNGELVLTTESYVTRRSSCRCCFRAAGTKTSRSRTACWKGDDTRQKPTGALEIWNDLPLSGKDEFELVSSVPSGWRGGFARRLRAAASRGRRKIS